MDGRFALELQAPVLRALNRYCREAESSETGGILVGRYSDDLSLAIVLEATPPPPDSRQGRSWFVRGVNGLRDMLDRRWRAQERTYYVGEWHLHPVAEVDPSRDDFTQMLEISQTEGYNCKNPILLILGRSAGEGGVRTMRAFVFATRKPMELYQKNSMGPSGLADPEQP